MKVYINEEWDSGGCDVSFSENISKYESDNPYIVDIDDNKLAKWKKILGEKERIDRKYSAIQRMLYDIKRTIDVELVEVICPKCNKSLAVCRENLPGYARCVTCSGCGSTISNNKDGELYAHNGEGWAGITNLWYKPTDKDKAEQAIRTFEQIEKQGGLKKQ